MNDLSPLSKLALGPFRANPPSQSTKLQKKQPLSPFHPTRSLPMKQPGIPDERPSMVPGEAQPIDSTLSRAEEPQKKISERSQDDPIIHPKQIIHQINKPQKKEKTTTKEPLIQPVHQSSPKIQNTQDRSIQKPLKIEKLSLKTPTSIIREKIIEKRETFRQVQPPTRDANSTQRPKLPQAIKKEIHHHKNTILKPLETRIVQPKQQQKALVPKIFQPILAQKQPPKKPVKNILGAEIQQTQTREKQTKKPNKTEAIPQIPTKSKASERQRTLPTKTQAKHRSPTVQPVQDKQDKQDKQKKPEKIIQIAQKKEKSLPIKPEKIRQVVVREKSPTPKENIEKSAPSPQPSVQRKPRPVPPKIARPPKANKPQNRQPQVSISIGKIEIRTHESSQKKEKRSATSPRTHQIDFQSPFKGAW